MATKKQVSNVTTEEAKVLKISVFYKNCETKDGKKFKKWLTQTSDGKFYDVCFVMNAKTSMPKASSNVCRKRRTALKSLLPFFSNVQTIDPNAICWSTLTFQRSNRSYRMLMNMCNFIMEGMLLTTETGTYRMATFSDEHMNRLFERFVLEYFRVHHKSINANAERVDWYIDHARESTCIDFLPSMQTDIVLRKNGRILIIDTKYYGKILRSVHEKESISSGNMYQIFSYVKNMDKDNTGCVSGMLLYAKTEEAVSKPIDAYFGKNRIVVKTIDLNQDFSVIKEQLDSITNYII